MNKQEFLTRRRGSMYREMMRLIDRYLLLRDRFSDWTQDRVGMNKYNGRGGLSSFFEVALKKRMARQRKIGEQIKEIEDVLYPV